MMDFYVVWSVYDDDREISHVLYRAVLSGVNNTVALVQAGSLAPQVVEFHTRQDIYPRDVSVKDVEVTVRPLNEYIDLLKANGKDLPNIDMFEEGEDD